MKAIATKKKESKKDLAKTIKARIVKKPVTKMSPEGMGARCN